MICHLLVGSGYFQRNSIKDEFAVTFIFSKLKLDFCEWIGMLQQAQMAKT